MKSFCKYTFIANMLIVLLLSTSTVSAQMFSYEKNPAEYTAVFPAGTFLKGVLQNDLSSEKNTTGDSVYVIIPFDVKIGKVTCIPAQTLVIGEVIQSQKARQGKNGFMQIKFDKMIFPDGTGTLMSAYIWSSRGNGMSGGETTKMRSYRKVPHYIQDLGMVSKLTETGERAAGKEKYIPAGTECVIVLDDVLRVNYLQRP